MNKNLKKEREALSLVEKRKEHIVYLKDFFEKNFMNDVPEHLIEHAIQQLKESNRNKLFIHIGVSYRNSDVFYYGLRENFHFANSYSPFYSKSRRLKRKTPFIVKEILEELDTLNPKYVENLIPEVIQSTHAFNNFIHYFKSKGHNVYFTYEQDHLSVCVEF